MRLSVLVAQLVSLILVVQCDPDAPTPDDTFPTDVVALACVLVNIPSPSGHEQAAFAYARAWLVAHNFTVVEQPVQPLSPSLAPRSNLLAHVPGAAPATLTVVLSTHLDTVPGTVAARGRAEDGEEDRLYGRGSVDAKGQAAAMLVALSRLRDGAVGLLLVCGEETDHAGMRAAHALRW